MITVIKSPAKVSLAENPVVFGIKTNNNIISAGTRAALLLHFGSVLYTGTGYQFTITFGGNTYTLTMADTPDNSGLQFPKAEQEDDTLSWMLKIKEALYANYYISEWYDITHTYSQVSLTAKQAGSAYNITASNISVPLFSATPTAGTDKQARPFFKIFLQANVGNNDIFPDMLPVDDQGRAYFDISEYLMPEVSNTFMFPEVSGTLMIKRPDCCKPFNVRYSEFYQENGSASIHKMNNAGTFYVMTGGVNSMTQARYNLLNTNFFSQEKNSHMFLTWHPGNKKTAQYDIQKLYYLVHTQLVSHNITSVRLKAALKYKLSGDTATTTTVLDKGSIQATLYDVIEICCGYSRLQLDVEAANLPAGSWVTGYDVYLTDDAGNIISEVKNFMLDGRTYMNYRTFLFRNSFGMYETIRTTSVNTKEAGYNNVVVNNMRRWNFTERTADNKKHRSYETARNLVNTGLVSKQEADWSRELFMSKEVYEIKDTMLYPVVITSETVKLDKDREFLYNVEFECVHGFTDQHYSLENKVKKIKIPQIIITEDIAVALNPHITITSATISNKI